MDIIFREEHHTLARIAQSEAAIKKPIDEKGFWSSLFLAENVSHFAELISALATKIGLNALQHRQLRKLLKKAIDLTEQVAPDSLKEQNLLNFLYADADEALQRVSNPSFTAPEFRSLRKILNALSKWLVKLTKIQQHRIELLQQRAFHLSMG
jgi:hypothetical protein